MIVHMFPKGHDYDIASAATLGIYVTTIDRNILRISNNSNV